MGVSCSRFGAPRVPSRRRVECTYQTSSFLYESGLGLKLGAVLGFLAVSLQFPYISFITSVLVATRAELTASYEGEPFLGLLVAVYHVPVCC